MLKEHLNIHRVFNIACGHSITLNNVIILLSKITSIDLKPIYEKERIGDIKYSEASIDRAQKELNYLPTHGIEEGLEILFKYISNNKI